MSYEVMNMLVLFGVVVCFSSCFIMSLSSTSNWTQVILSCLFVYKPLKSIYLKTSTTWISCRMWKDQRNTKTKDIYKKLGKVIKCQEAVCVTECILHFEPQFCSCVDQKTRYCCFTIVRSVYVMQVVIRMEEYFHVTKISCMTTWVFRMHAQRWLFGEDWQESQGIT